MALSKFILYELTFFFIISQIHHGPKDGFVPKKIILLGSCRISLLRVNPGQENFIQISQFFQFLSYLVKKNLFGSCRKMIQSKLS